MNYPNKLPDVGTTIFAIMSKMAQDNDAINLSQGFPDFQTSERLINLVHKHMLNGANQYAAMPGHIKLRERISEKTESLYGVYYNPESEVTVTSGATEALFVAISAVTEPGDEIIIFEPAYDSYKPVIDLNGGICIPVRLEAPEFKIDWNKVEEKISNKTKAVIFNTPHNPTGSIWSDMDLQRLAEIAEAHNLWVISDEVYEHIIFDDEVHQSAMLIESLKERSFIISSFGKTYHNTGWKVGYCVAPEALSKSFRKIHQFVCFSTHTPSQLAFADFLQFKNEYLDLPRFYQRRRNKFLELIKDSKFEFSASKGTYFQLLSYGHMDERDDKTYAEYLTKEYKIASIPISVFYSDGYDPKMLRFCFAKSDETLVKAANILCRI
ncbi:aminotransferase class I/II-fold pyridoxal phosphate-dependent enzyme [Hyphobacterium sp. CCMP332]|nr:aminotransferase class I/II-fold pyridoxal phosphate-dependent enzyme [Hyphobacterium sp. CCMP332]